MKSKTHVEPGTLADGTLVYRWRCEACTPNLVGAWLLKLDDVERNRGLHERSQHPAKEAA